MLLLAGAAGHPAAARTWVVDDDRAQAAAAEFTRIGPALAASAAGDTIVVQPGYYPENLRFPTHDVHLRGSAPEVPTTVAATVVDGRLLGPVVTLASSATPACVVEGLTLTRGQAFNGGAICGDGSTAPWATIRNNVLRENYAVDNGGAIHGQAGTISRNLFENNRAEYGGALASCSGLVESNTLRGNQAAVFGGGAYSCGGTLRRNVIEANRCDTGFGGGLALCSGLIELNTIQANTANEGGGAARLFGRVERNTFIANQALQNGGALAGGECALTSNTFERNTAGGDGGALADLAGPVVGNQVRANLARNGGGLWRCRGLVAGNAIEANLARAGGGGLADCDGRLMGNTLRGNRAAAGGGLHGCDGRIAENYVVDNRAVQGGGLYGCDARVQCNVIAANVAETTGSALAAGAGLLLHNTIAWNGRLDAPTTHAAAIELASGCLLRGNLLLGNAGPALGWPTGALPPAALAEDNAAALLPGLRLPAPVRPLALGNWFHGNGALGRAGAAVGGGELLATVGALESALPGSSGNGSGEPYLRRAALAGSDPAGWALADYTPAAGSPLVDAGTLHVYALGAARDAAGRARLAGAQPDIGALEADAQPDADGDALPDAAEAAAGCDAAAFDSDGDGVADGLEMLRRGTNPAASNAVAGGDAGLQAGGPGGLWPQEALVLAFRGETVDVAAGLYYDPLLLEGKAVRLRGPALDGATTTPQARIDAAGAAAVLMLAADANTSTVIERLELSHGRAAEGGAVQGNGGGPRLQDLLVTSCTTRLGGTVDQCSGPLTGCTFAGNQAGEGGAVRLGRGTLQGLRAHGNRAASGGALARTGGRVERGIFQGNSATVEGGALARVNGPLVGCQFEGNVAPYGGAATLGYGAFSGCIFTANQATRSGGAVYGWGGSIESSTFTLNVTAGNGGAIHGADKTVRRCVISRNRAMGNGGGIANAFGGVDGCTVTLNRCENNGGGLSDIEELLNGCYIAQNQATEAGGGVAFVAMPITACTIVQNTAKQGGGLYYCHQVLGNLIAGNTAQIGGGGVYYGQGELRGNELRGNTALQGGAVGFFRGQIEANLMRGNRAEGRGGALWFCGADLRNNLLIDNATTGTVGSNPLGTQPPGGGAAAECSGAWENNLLAYHGAATTGSLLLDCPLRLAGNLILGSGGVLVNATTAANEPLAASENVFDTPGAAMMASGGSVLGDLAATEAARPGKWSANLAAPAGLVGPLGPAAAAEAFAPAAGSPAIDAARTTLATDYAGRRRPLDGDGDGQAYPDAGPWEYVPRSAAHAWSLWE